MALVGKIADLKQSGERQHGVAEHRAAQEPSFGAYRHGTGSRRALRVGSGCAPARDNADSGHVTVAREEISAAAVNARLGHLERAVPRRHQNRWGARRRSAFATLDAPAATRDERSCASGARSTGALERCSCRTWMTWLNFVAKRFDAAV